jgi:hypothetical protein
MVAVWWPLKMGHPSVTFWRCRSRSFTPMNSCASGTGRYAASKKNSPEGEAV